jgi:hypothetical protein
MRIHSNTLTVQDLDRAMRAAGPEAPGVTMHVVGTHGSSRFRQSFEVALRGHGSRHKRPPNTRDDSMPGKAATRDDWGWFISAVYDLDSAARFGPYKGSDDFHKATHDAYVN